MCARPRKVSDDDIFMAAQRVMSKLGPAELTLADIATEAGVTPGLLVQRFGSKRDLLLSLSERFSGGTAEMFAELRKGRRSPIAVLRAYCDCMANLASNPAAFARNFAYLQIDLTDADFRQHLAKHARASRDEFEQLIREAIAAGELVKSTNPRQLARTIETVVNGSMLSWAFYQEGSAAKWMRQDLDAVLKPYMA